MTKPGLGGRPCEQSNGVPMRTILHINVPNELADKLRRRAKAKGVTMARVCRVYLERACR